MALLTNSSVVLCLPSLICSPLQLHSGLAQGCPLSCNIYVLAVDPVLEYTHNFTNIEMVIGFCDDWTIECATASALISVQDHGEEFENASGQQIH